MDAESDQWLLKIPLLDGKGIDTFNPDFIVWTENEILA